MKRDNEKDIEGESIEISRDNLENEGDGDEETVVEEKDENKNE